MGCDIHCYIEFNQLNRYPGWQPFGGRINPGRNYGIFARLAGVRGETDKKISDPRGLPADVAYAAQGDNTLYITSTGREDDSCTKEQAESWVKCGVSEYTSDEKTSVTHPDWHSHSWVTLPEWVRALKGVRKQYEPQYHAITAILRSLKASGAEVRVVFWFDN